MRSLLRHMLAVQGWHGARFFLEHLLFASLTTFTTRHLHTWRYSFASPHCRVPPWPSPVCVFSTLNPPVLPSFISCLVLYTIESMANNSAHCLAARIRANGNRTARGSIHAEQATCYSGGCVFGIWPTLLNAGQCSFRSHSFPLSRLTLLPLCTLHRLASNICVRRQLWRKRQPNSQCCCCKECSRKGKIVCAEQLLKMKCEHERQRIKRICTS